jgi:acyl-CoA oxidase
MLHRGGAIRFFGTKRHHDKWLQKSEDYIVWGCFAMTELGHGSNVSVSVQCFMCNGWTMWCLYKKSVSRMELWWLFPCQVCGIETPTTYDPETEEFVINTPCESAQKYWIGGAAKVHKSLHCMFKVISVTDKCTGTPNKCMDLLDLAKHKKEEANCSWSFYSMRPILLSSLSCQ